jgi:ABC-type branched-subunit amino acid transport system substrate-binding protein
MRLGPFRGISMLCSIFAALSAGGCNAIIGLSEYSVASGAADGGSVDAGVQCVTNTDCNLDESAGNLPAICLKPDGRCVPLKSADCQTVTGDYLDDRAIILGSMFSLTGTQLGTNLPRQQSAALAVEEINAAGGIPQGATSADGRPLVLVSCDESVDLIRAGEHLVKQLRVPAIVGPNTSQDTLDLSNRLTIAEGTVVMTPSGLASSIADLLDEGLTWQMVPNDVQRGPIMIQQINALEAQLREARGVEQVRLGVVFRNDALGVGTRVSLNSLVLNGKSLTDSTNLGTNVRIDSYEVAQVDQRPLVEAYVAFAPDIVVLAGTAEIVPNIMVALERAWPSDRPRPIYLAIDPLKAAELIGAVTNNEDLRRRVRGTGVTPSPNSKAVYDAFKVSYELRYPGMAANASAMGPSYDAVYAIAYAIAATRDLPVTGASITRGLRRLTGGTVAVELQSTQVLAAFQRLVAGQAVNAVGTFGPLAWNQSGAVLGGTLEVWCIGLASGKPVYQSSGLTLDLATGKTSGTYTQCGP